jgi:hypothetical protein
MLHVFCASLLVCSTYIVWNKGKSWETSVLCYSAWSKKPGNDGSLMFVLPLEYVSLNMIKRTFGPEAFMWTLGV